MTAELLSEDNPPYLTLTITQALELPDPPAPEPRQHVSVNALLDFRATQSPSKIGVGFTSLFTSTGSSPSWTCTSLTYDEIRRLSLNLARSLGDQLQSSSPIAAPTSRVDKKVASRNGSETTDTKGSGSKNSLVAVLSPSGLDLFAHILALWRLGYGVLCIAPGTPAESIANLLRLTATRTILAHPSQIEAAQAGIRAAVASFSTPTPSPHDDVEEQRNFAPVMVEMLQDVKQHFLGSQDKSLDADQIAIEEKHDPEATLVVMHTSGSSGLPKPIYQLHRFWTNSLASAAGTSRAAFTTTPLFHGGMSDMLRSIQADSTIFLHPTADPGALSSLAIYTAIHSCPQTVEYFLSVPYILELLFEDRSGKGTEMLKAMQLVSTGGAPLSPRLGDQMVKEHIRLVSRLGSSECGFLMSSWRDFNRDPQWSYLRIPDQLGQKWIRFESQIADRDTNGKPKDDGPCKVQGPFELVVGPEWPTKLVSNRGDGSYATSDLYSAHPSKPNVWKYDSRSDDTIVLVSGKKAMAPSAELKLKQSDVVQEAIVFGSNRAILGALVFVAEQAVPQSEQTELKRQTKLVILKKLQAIVEQEINGNAPPHAQLVMEMIHLLPPKQASGIPRASKGSLQRGRAYQQYADLIDKIYTDFEEGRSLSLSSSSSPSNGGGSSRQSLSGTDLVRWIQDTVSRINNSSTKTIHPETDFFVAGIDSIQAARIRASIHQHIELGGGDRLLAKNVVYDFPTPQLLADHIEQVRRSDDKNGLDEHKEHENQKAEWKLMRELVDKYSEFDGDTWSKQAQQPAKQTKGKTKATASEQSNINTADGVEKGPTGTLYILTGVTGGLGAQILDQVVQGLGPTDTIACLVRAKDSDHAFRRVFDALSSRELNETLESIESVVSNSRSRSDSRKVMALASDLSAPNCGTPESTIMDLLEAREVERVVTIHAAWAVNFVAGLRSFEQEQIRGLHNLILLHESILDRIASVSPSSRATRSNSVFAFCSSTASILGQPPLGASGSGSGGGYPEDLSEFPQVAIPMGYARSKWVAEHVVSRAAFHAFPSSLDKPKFRSRYAILRIGQLTADTKHGCWNQSEAWPILLSLSSQLGSLPILRDEYLDWLPTDVAARTIMDIVDLRANQDRGSREKNHQELENEQESSLGIYHIALPTTTTTATTTDSNSRPSWSDLYTWLNAAGLRIEWADPVEWLKLVQAQDLNDRGLLSLWQRNFSHQQTQPTKESTTTNNNNNNNNNNQTTKTAAFDTTNTTQVSPTFRSWTGVDKNLIAKTVTRWKKVGFLP